MKNKILLVFLVFSLFFTVAVIMPAPTQAAVTKKVTNLKVVEKYPEKIDLQWKKKLKVLVGQKKLAVKFYQVKVSKKVSGKYKKIKRVKTSKNIRTKTVAKLSNSMTYYFQVRACKTKTKCGTYSDRVKGKTKAAVDSGDDEEEEVVDDEEGDEEVVDDEEEEEDPAPDPDPAPAAEFTISSTAFTDGGNIPDAYTCVGTDISPALAWENAPDGTESFILIVRDIDVGGEGVGEWIHWSVKNISSSATGVAENSVPSGGIEVLGDWDPETSYGGPCPPLADGAHSYRFEIYALSTATVSGSDSATVESNMVSYILDSDYITGEYDRN